MTNYLDEYKTLHKDNPGFGSGACIYLPEICLAIDYLKPKTILDFGCGKANLIKELVHRYPNIEFYGYDPAIPGRDVLPIEKADLVINTDVLEHIPEEILPSVIEKIASTSDHVIFELHHALAYQILPNGENAHCTVKPPQWYYELLCRYFKTHYPLPGRKPELSCVITFAPSIDFLNSYHEMIEKKPNIQNLQQEIQKLASENHDNLTLLLNKNSIYLHYYRCKLLAKLTFGKKRRHYKAKRNLLHEQIRRIRGAFQGQVIFKTP